MICTVEFIFSVYMGSDPLFAKVRYTQHQIPCLTKVYYHFLNLPISKTCQNEPKRVESDLS
jgi:hypothetical protein